MIIIGWNGIIELMDIEKWEITYTSTKRVVTNLMGI